MKSLASINILLRALGFVLLAFICTGNSFKQELWLYDAQDNALQFHSHVSDLSGHSSFLANVTRVCTRGEWLLYSNANFQTELFWPGSICSSGIQCYNFTTAASVKSLRYEGANDIDTDALSLYELDAWSGKEVFVTTKAHTGITHQIWGVIGTGTSDWTLFEAQELEGKSVSFQVPQSGCYLSRAYVRDLNLTTVGSVFKGCDAQEIQNYKMLHKSSIVNSD